MAAQDDAPHKRCKQCGEEKPLDDFGFESRVNDQRQARCCICVYFYHRQWAAANADRVSASRARYVERHEERWHASRKARLSKIKAERIERRAVRGIPPLEPRVTDDGRRCSYCRRRKSADQFGEIGVYCRDCAAFLGRKRLAALDAEGREKRRRHARKYDIWRLYKISVAELEVMLEAQGGGCGICGRPIDLWASRKENGAAVDHDHVTKRVRGLLCRLCNVGIGHFRERPSALRAAIKYLLSHGVNDD